MSEKRKLKCTEKDILMGRGKRVSEWPGNINFRQLINRYREKYNAAERSRKVFVAQDVIKEIHSIGGRFLKESINGSWEEIEMARSVEKTCQALREKEKANPPTGSPFADGVSRDGGPPPVKRRWKKPGDRTAGGKPGPKKRRRHTDDDDDDDSSSGSGSTETESDDDDEETETETETEMKPTAHKKRPPKVPEWDHGDMMRQMSAFAKLYEHGAVPPAYKDNPKLGDWAIIQRQLYREKQGGFLELSEAEKKRLEDLDALGFVWDYDDWHWENRYKELLEWHDKVAALEKSGKASPTLAATVAPPKQEIVDWLQEQRRQHKEGSWNVPAHRVEKLRKIGVTF